MTAEEYTIERLMLLEKENGVLRGLNNRYEEDKEHLIKTCDRLNDLNRGYSDKLEEIKQIMIFTLDNEEDHSSGITINKEDMQELIKILDIIIDEEAPDEVPED